jgi:predicted DNA-binding protein
MRTTVGNTFLSVRVPAVLRRRIKELAAQRQTSVQELVRQAIEDFLQDADKSPPDLAETLVTLRAHAVHQYFRIDQRRIWQIVQRDIPPLEAAIAFELKRIASGG